jgi:hypothetical protein
MIKQERQEGIKAGLVLMREMKKTDHKTGEIMNAQPHFTTKFVTILKEEDVPYNDMVEKMLESLENYQTMGSGWVFVRVILLTFSLTACSSPWFILHSSSTLG